MWKPIILDVECIVCNKSLQKINHDPREVTRKMGKIANNRRSRTPNWSVDEKQYLLELIRERKEVVVPKTTNGPIHYEEKDVAWNEILRELAARYGNKFQGSNIKKVKTQWQNMKRIAREEISINGPEVEKYTRQSREVCSILDLVKDGVLVKDAEEPSPNSSAISGNIEIKTERIDDEMNHPGCSETDMETDPTPAIPDQPQPAVITLDSVHLLESSGSSVSEQASDFEPDERGSEALRPPEVIDIARRTVSANTETSYFEDNMNVFNMNNVNPFQRDLQEFFRYTTTEKQLKVETLKEERQVLRAMRETAELNKIIAEQRLKHVLWAKKQDMAMYSGEPGSGAGKGGGGGGAIREAGGAFGKMEAAREEEYFYKKQKEQIQTLKTHLDKEIAFHQEQIKRHEDAIRRHKTQMADMEKKN